MIGSPRNASGARQGGMALISGLLLLVVVTLLAVSMFRGYGMEEKIAGNTREKQRALNAAESAQQYAEWWLSSNTPPAAAVCNGFVPANVGQVCSNLQVDFTQLPWAAGVTYTPFTAAGNIIATNAPAAGTYAGTPVFYVTDLGPPAAGAGEIYQIDAVGWGGSTNAVAVVESTYLVLPAAYSGDK